MKDRIVRRFHGPLQATALVLGILLAVLGAQELLVYQQASEELLNLQRRKIELLEENGGEASDLKAVEDQISYLEQSRHFDRSVTKGLVLLVMGVCVSFSTGFIRSKADLGEVEAEVINDDASKK